MVQMETDWNIDKEVTRKTVFELDIQQYNGHENKKSF